MKAKQTVIKGKHGVFRVIFTRATFFVLLMLFQISFLVWIFQQLNQFSVYAYYASTLLSAILLISLVNKAGNPAFKIAWALLIFIFPIFGSLAYMFVHLRIGTRSQHKKLRMLIKETSPFLKQDQAIINEVQQKDPQVANLFRYINSYGGYPVYQNTSSTYYPSGETTFDELRPQLEAAEHFIFMEFYIIAEGPLWNGILDILKRKVAEGVEVRLMYDGMCSLGKLPYRYSKKLNELGIQCKVFSPLRPALSSHQNNRDHRKIVVIDGHTAFTGGVNLADEYVNVGSRFGHWKDTAIMIQGSAVRNFTLMFLQMWNLNESIKPENFFKYLIPQKHFLYEATGYVLPYAESPLDDELVAESVYLDMIQTATRYVHIFTPYLILDNEMLQALCFAAKRGVEVSIIMPGIPDKWYAFAVAKTYYEELLKAGVSIYQYTPGFLHAKSFVVDDVKAVVGTINMDYRSFYLHFECGIYLYQNEAISDVEKDFQETREKCHLVTLKDCKNLKWTTRLAGHFLRLFAPLM